MQENLINKVYKKLDTENTRFKESIKKLNPSVIIDCAYEITIKNEIVNDFYSCDYNDMSKLRALLYRENALDYLYQEWIKTDGYLFDTLKESVTNSLDSLENDYLDNIKKGRNTR